MYTSFTKNRQIYPFYHGTKSISSYKLSAIYENMYFQILASLVNVAKILEIIFYEPLRPKGFFSISNHHKWLSKLFPLNLNTYAMGLQPLKNIVFFHCGNRF